MHDITKEFLIALSDRLSGRSDCKGVEYIVAISVSNVDMLDKYGLDTNSVLHGMNLPDKYLDNVVIFHPYRLVYPNRYERKESNKLNVLELIAKRFDGLFNGLTDDGDLYVNSGYLSPGLYRYTLSVDRRRRKWERLY